MKGKPTTFFSIIPHAFTTPFLVLHASTPHLDVCSSLPIAEDGMDDDSVFQNDTKLSSACENIILLLRISTRIMVFSRLPFLQRKYNKIVTQREPDKRTYNDREGG